jgi:hypothetical protein
MQQQELNDLLQATSADAKNYAKEEHQVALDDSVTSIIHLDQILAELHERELKQPHSAELIFTLCNMLGAYIGEVFIHNVGGQWQYNQLDAAAPFVYVQLNDKEFPFASVCYHKITRDNSISLYGYIKIAMANAMQ